ncbi:RagB/SusD family nutrient uptake outer membrane protein [Dysgonomonas sp. 520]|uniref:RagB/SusD family nutrient uptake outer membrane protein n=1 Tax=Dysgonomonas sp. 520 TaxID=2302931 RepID=UPI0013CF58F2|nr:RagB/SusD family nutrient uptake outer membrane protein [Dysgonomonas sp. 520]NDW08450.1 RagB/SusD family nutrient uptake outer membrane protein [Dysgonomonas sp. 520]
MKKIIYNIKRIMYISAVIMTSLAMVTACTDDLDTEEKGPNVEQDPYQDPDNYPILLSKIYAGFSRIGLTGPDGDGDVPSSADQGKTNFLRIYFNMQELTSDEAKCAWNDNDEKYYSQSMMMPDNSIGYMFYQRCMTNIAFANEFIRNTANPVVEVNDLDRMREEARVLRALNYYFLIDLVGNPGWITDEHPIDGSYKPKQIGREGLFDWIESELIAVLESGTLKDYSAYTYGMVTNQMVQTILAKLYINAEVYTGKARWSDALKYASMVTSHAGLKLEDNYQNLFCADNHRSSEIIFALSYDFDYARDWGGTKFIMAASSNADVVGDLLNFTDGWAGNRATQQLANLFSGSDKRALFYKSDRTKEMDVLGDFKSGWSVVKFTNRAWDGADNPRGNTEWPDTDFPLFRLADVLLIQAEAELRSGSSNAVNTFNKVYAHSRTGLSPKTSITLQDILDERGRELYWEAHRRTDLIRFGKFSTGYNWAWKGGVKDGKDIDKKYELFPLSTRHLTGNPELEQTELYR